MLIQCKPSFDILQFDDANIVLVEAYPCKSSDELRQREQYWIDCTPNCVNKANAYRNMEKIKEYQKQRYNENRETIKEYDKQRYNKNREAILEKKKKHLENNREAVNAHRKENYAKNKERINARKRELNKKYMCVCSTCGVVYHKHSFKSHNKTKIHQKHEDIQCRIQNTNDDYETFVKTLPQSVIA